MKHFLKKYVEPILPLYAVIPLIGSFLINSVVYSTTMALCADLPHYDFTTDLDRMVPFVPWFVYIYFLSFPFWAVNYILIGRGEKKQFYQFLTADLSSRMVCLFFFVFVPTTNVRPEVTGISFADNLMRMLYSIDQPTNLFPSIHCLMSWFCFIGIKDRTDIPVWYKSFSCVFAILIFISTQVTKQHYLIDIAGGVLLAEVTFRISRRVQAYRYVQKFYERINAWIINDNRKRGDTIA